MDDEIEHVVEIAISNRVLACGSARLTISPQHPTSTPESLYTWITN